jgi:hypothetical protein
VQIKIGFQKAKIKQKKKGKAVVGGGLCTKTSNIYCATPDLYMIVFVSIFTLIFVILQNQEPRKGP